ncbi:MAG: hypothetical protein JWQ79_2547 [Mucilaginibacter sp.]|nr:hypothetical protein [Mucilaginibacter sp.]
MVASVKGIKWSYEVAGKKSGRLGQCECEAQTVPVFSNAVKRLTKEAAGTALLP